MCDVKPTSVFDFYRKCVKARHDGKLIVPLSSKDKEFHFQNWCQARLQESGLNFDTPKRNTYPDFSLVDFPEGYEIKGLAYPGRESDFDANSNLPTGSHNGRTVFYVFGRYPADPANHKVNNIVQYPVMDLVILHGDFLSAYRDYCHENKHVNGFGTYGDIKIRDRKMYVVPTPFALAEGTTGLNTLILPESYVAPKDFARVGKLVRKETDQMVIGYHFDLQNNKIESTSIPNPAAGAEHVFYAYRLTSESIKTVTMNEKIVEDDEIDEDEDQ